MESIENNNILVLGDYHLRKAQQLITAKLTNFKNVTWKCSKWHNIKSAKKEFFKYKETNDIPSVVILQVGNNDLTKVSTPNCVISSLLRTAKAFYKRDVSAVIICSLVERGITIRQFNSQVNKVNAIISSNAAKLEWMHFFVMLNSKLYTATEIYSTNKRNLLAKPLETIASDLKKFLEGASFVELVKKDEKNTRSSRTNTGGSRSAVASKKSIFHKERNSLQLKLSAKLLEKAKVDEYASLLETNVVLMTQELSILETLDS